MKLWLVCFLLLFGFAETAQWLGQLAWFDSVELSLPLTIVGGVGLAIASNYATLFGRSQPGAIAPKPAPPPAPPPSPQLAAPAQATQASRKGDTISFEIKKPSRGVGE
ncbi:MAG: hypothetical protein ACFCVB_01925 [Nodosilinea sp.]